VSRNGEAPSSAEPLRVRLYIAGDSPNSLAALHNLRRVLEERPDHAVELEIIDVLHEPLRGVQDRVVATPLLVKVAPAPERRVLGNLRDQGVLLGVLGLSERIS
jgi:circadian clock protein KaiB